ncbi:MAG TPA: Asp-tRNA(Asn)/Glu-tRNA(Gln) amidotransferase subunit GatB [Candidatus Dormibacteraeota bacterium]|nr:Asp-tRNA(Asn)/Glu-tRNA(Gln) amidotransferase subunit GatB [Candidatus Dormibacteraeota bacterium]
MSPSTSGAPRHLPAEREGAWEVVIGMEVHVQPKTRSKMFCGCAVAPLNAPPNTYTCEVCLGMPGVLPAINIAAVEACLKTALALSCEIPRHTKFDRKNYMYPDLPKGYQISQYDLPMSVNGHIEVGGRTVRIRRVHLEEDTGKLVHAGDKLHRAWESYVDLNRAGVPLMEIVSEPDLRSADEARDYAMELRTVLRNIGASEADMEKGQMRVEPNISVRKVGSSGLGVKTELKNINSFRALHRAISYEVARHVEVLQSGGAVVQETRGWSEDEQRTFSQRSKEFAEDYRYFPEPDLPPLELDRAWIEELRRNLPELPAVTRAALEKELPAAVAALIGESRDLTELYRQTIARGASSTATANWIVNEVAPSGKIPSPDNLAELVRFLEDGAITRDQGREVLAESVETGRTPAEIVAEHGFRQTSDPSELLVIAEAVIDANPKAASDYRAGKTQAIYVLVKDFRARAPQANPKVANELLTKLLS